MVLVDFISPGLTEKNIRLLPQEKRTDSSGPGRQRQSLLVVILRSFPRRNVVFRTVHKRNKGCLFLQGFYEKYLSSHDVDNASSELGVGSSESNSAI